MKKIIICLFLTMMVFSCATFTHNSDKFNPNIPLTNPVDYSVFADSEITTTLQMDTPDLRAIVFSPDDQYMAINTKQDIALLVNIESGKIVKRFGNSGPISFNPNGEQILIGATLWSINGDFISRFGNDLQTSSVAFSPDGRFVAIGDYLKEKCFVFDENGNQIAILDANGEHNYSSSIHISFSPDSKMIAVGMYYEIKYYTVKGVLKQTIKLPEYVSDISISSDGKFIAYALDGGDRDGWNYKIPEEKGPIFLQKFYSSFSTNDVIMHNIEEWRGSIKSLQFSSDGEFLVSNGGRASIKIWNKNHELVKDFFGDYFSLSNKNDYIAINNDGTISLYALSNGEKYKEIVIANAEKPYSASVSEDGRYIAIGTNNGINIWDLKSAGSVTKIIPNLNQRVERIEKLEKLCGRLSDLGQLDVSTQAHLKIEINNETNNGSIISNVEFHPSGKHVVCSESEYLYVYDYQGNLINRKEYEETIKDFSFNNDGKLLALIINSGENLLLINYDKNETLFNKEGDFDRVSFSPNGKYIAANAEEQIFLFNLDGSLLNEFPVAGHCYDINFSDDSQYIYTDATSGMGLYNLTGNNILQVSSSGGPHTTAVNISEDNRLLLVGTDEGDVLLFSNRGKLIREYSAICNSTISSIGFFPSKAFFYVTSFDGSSRICNINNGETISLYLQSLITDYEWMVRDKNGQFNCSTKGNELINFVQGFNVYEPEQFWDKFFAPDLVSKFLNNTNDQDYNIDDAIKELPVVDIVNKKQTNEGQELSITLSITPGADGIGDIFVLHNGRVIDENTRGLKVQSSGKTQTFTFKLIEGDNLIQGCAYEESNELYGTSSLLKVNYTPPVVIKPDMYVISVGVSGYSDSNLSLKAPAKDAKDIARLFDRIGSNLYDDVYSDILIDSSASKENIEYSLKSLIDKVDARDTVIIFLAGHGFVENEDYYYLPYNADVTDMENSCVDIATFSELFRELPANKIAMFLDTCQSGAAVSELNIAMSRSVEETRLVANLAKARGIAVFSASAANQAAYEIPKLGNGIFTYSIIKAINNQKDDISIDGNISLAKLMATVNYITRNTAYEYLGYEQTPLKYAFGDDFYVGKVR